MSFIPKRRVVFTAGCLLATTAGLLWLAQNEPSLHPATAGPAGKKTDTADSTDAGPKPSRPQRTAKAGAGGRPVRLESDDRWDVNIGGQPRSIVIALDEAVTRDSDGRETVVKLTPPATEETLAERLADLPAESGVFPVAYLAGEERSAATRRLITPDLRVQLDAAAADRLAASHRLAIKDRPDYAPGWVIMTAPSPLAALDAMMGLRDEREIASADVLLATQHSLRALPNDPLVTQQWHIKRSGTAAANTDVNIESAWNYGGSGGVKGTGVRIGIVDDGLQTTHPDLLENVSASNHKDWNGNDLDPNPGTDDDHGTACAGNAAARGNNSLGVSGTAPQATLIGMRLIAASVTDAQEAEAMNYLPQLVEIKSNSWGPNDTGNILEGPGPLTLSALQTATTSGRGGKGTIFLWAGGNGGDVGDNSNYDGYANSIYTIAIGATDSAGNRAYYSEPGANLVVCAPSSGSLGITTVDRTGTNGYNTSSGTTGDYTNDFGGTSSATPTAAGIVALMLEKNPNLGWRDVQEILIRSAYKFKPADTGWVNNGAGFHFNHQFGAGLVDATAAVNLAGTWTNLPAQTSGVSTQSGLSAAIPNNNTTGVTRTFDLSSTNIRVEQVTLKLSATHTARGNLAVTLTSPTGMVSNLAEVHSDTGDHYSNWTFSSVRHWGEMSSGTWTLKVADLSSTGNSTGGTLTAAELTVFGSPGTPVNPAPVVQITSPSADQVFSPGSVVNVNVTATDTTIGGGTGTVTQVELLDNGTPVGTDTSAPYSFSFTPTTGSHTLVARATDSEGAVGQSISVNISVVNQAPVITAASLSATGQAYADVPLTVSSVSSSDPEGSPVTYTYQWQSSVNQTVYTDEAGATGTTAPAIAGRLWRCVVTPSDGNSAGSPFTTASVNLLVRPGMTATLGSSYSYTSGLVLRGTDSPLSRRAIVNEFSQGPSGTSEWIEILTLQAGSLAYWDLHDSQGEILVFLDDPVWDNIPAGTLIVIYNGASKDPLLPADDLDPSDGRMVVSSTNPAYFDSEYSTWLPLGNNGDTIFLADDESAVVHQVAYGNSTDSPNVGSVGSAKSAYYAGDTDAGADVATNWRVTTATTARAIAPRVPAALPISFGGPWSTLPTGFTGSGLGTPYSSELGGDTAGGSARFDTTGDSMTIEISAQATSVTYQIRGNPGSGTATSGTFLLQESPDGGTFTTLRTITNATNADTAYSDVPAAATRYLRFLYQTKGAGNIQMDKLSITGAVANGLVLSISPTTFAEDLGASAATGTVTIPSALASPLTINLSSSDTSEATVPATITIAAGQTVSPAFVVTAVDDMDSDGPQQVTITASAASYANGSVVLTVTDNETPVEGVTPAAANNAANQSFVTALRTGSLNSPALFRTGVGAVIPAGLTLDSISGTLSGTIANSNAPGDFLIVIERYNTLGETVSQSYTLTIGTGTGGDYAAWISGYAVQGLTGPKDDPDFDGLSNAIENILGTAPNVANQGLTMVSASGGNLVFRHTRSNTIASDVVPAYEWSTNLMTWQASGATAGGSTVTIVPVTITDNTAPANDLVEVTATITGTPQTKVFVRLKAVK